MQLASVPKLLTCSGRQRCSGLPNAQGFSFQMKSGRHEIYVQTFPGGDHQFL